MATSIRIGTAGWAIPAQHAARFRGDGSHLQRYSHVLTCAEINTSFYRPHRRSTYERWAASTPPSFRFAVKIPKQLTHTQRLEDSAAVLDRFGEEVSGLGRKLAVVLVQLPPSLVFDEDVGERFFAALRDRVNVSIACEPRHRSWFEAHVDQWLKENRIARVAADPAPVAGAEAPGGWRGLTYIRLHGSPRKYWSSYARSSLKGHALQLRSAKRQAWCILDNTAGGHAAGDAVWLQRFLLKTATQDRDESNL